uniref:RWD domain-containing protein n=1 Tax=Ciona savignyi TaxID=51511 RepID=H2YN28_CIOSA
MDASELQEEEREVLASIFEDDPAFKQISDQCFQYKIGEDADMKSFLIEVVWTKEYPNELPRINLDAFYNNHILPSVKTNIVEQLTAQCEGILGEAMVFTIVDWAKENHVELMAEQPLQVVVARNDVEASPAETAQTGKKKEKKEQLSKAQKRKLADRVGVSGERPRGWDWVDLIKHLSQTGKANER